MNITELLEQLNIEIAPPNHHHVTSGWTQVDCPWCEVYSHYRLGIPNNSTEWCRCFVCGWKPLPHTLARLANQRWTKIKKLLGSVEIDFLPEQLNLRGRLILPVGLAELKQIHCDYLSNRGFNPQELASVWQIRGIGPAPELSWRIFIPIIYKGKTISWTTRKVNEVGTKYITARPDQEIVSPRSILFGEDLARHTIVVTEGPFDAMAIGPGAAATLGLGYSQEQLAKIAGHPRRIICFDSEELAQSRARSLCKDLSTFEGQTIRVELCEKDAADCLLSKGGRKDLAKIRKMLK